MNSNYRLKNSLNPLQSFLWIPLIFLPILAFLGKPKPITLSQPPQEFFRRQNEYFSQRNAVVNYWDQIYCSLGSTATESIYATRTQNPKLIKIRALHQPEPSDGSVNKIELEISAITAKSIWTISVNPHAYQLIRINDSVIQSPHAIPRILKHQLNWLSLADTSKLIESNASALKNLLIKINNRQFHKNFQQLIELTEAHKKLRVLLNNPSLKKIKKALQSYLKYQKSIILLEFASRTNQYNLKQNILLAKRYELLDQFILSDSDIFKLPLSSLQLELNVSIDALSTPQIQSNFIRMLCREAAQNLQNFDLNIAPWRIVTSLARSYQIEAKTYNFDHPQNKKLNAKVKNLIIPEQKTSIAFSRAYLQPEGSDFNLGSAAYLRRLAVNLHVQNIKLRNEKIPHITHFSQSVQAVKLNGKHYVIDTGNKSCFVLDGLQFQQISNLPDEIPPLSQAIVQEDPITGQSAILIIGGYPESNSIFKSNDLIKFEFVPRSANFYGRFYFGLSKFRNPSNGFESTILVGGTKGQKNDIARFEDNYHSINGLDWKRQSSLSWTSRHSFAMTQIKDSLLLMGGCRTFQSGPCYSEIWSSADAISFEKVVDAPWSARGGMATVKTPYGLLLFGGADERKVYADLWKTSNGRHWVKIDIDTVGSTHSQIIYDEDRLWIVGGITATGNRAPTRSFKIIRNAIQFL